MANRRAARLLFPIAVTATLAMIAGCSGGTGSSPSVLPTATVEPTSTSVPTPEPTVEPSPTAVSTEPPEEYSHGPGVAGKVKSVIFGQELENLTVPVGTTVTWINDDVEDHNITSGTDRERLALFDSGTMREGDKFSLNLDEPGVFPYFCTLHPNTMEATITVVGEPAADDVTSDPTPAPTATATQPPEPTDTLEPLPTNTLDPLPTPTAEPTPTATAVPMATPPPTVAAEPTQTASPTPEPPLAVASVIQNFRLQNLSVSVGTTVIWTNLDSAQHTTTSGNSPNPSGVWHSLFLDQDSQFSHTFNQAGTFAYFCRVHPGMTGTVTVSP